MSEYKSNPRKVVRGKSRNPVDQKFRTSVPKAIKKKSKMDNIPMYLRPVVYKSKAGKLLCAEVSNIVSINDKSTASAYSAQIVTNSKGARKRAVFVFRDSNEGKMHESMLFYVTHGSYVIAENHVNYINGRKPGICRVFVYRFRKDGEKGKRRTIYIPIAKYNANICVNNALGEWTKDHDISDCGKVPNPIKDEIMELFKRKKIEFLEPALNAAFEKASSDMGSKIFCKKSSMTA